MKYHIIFINPWANKDVLEKTLAEHPRTNNYIHFSERYPRNRYDKKEITKEEFDSLNDMNWLLPDDDTFCGENCKCYKCTEHKLITCHRFK